MDTKIFQKILSDVSHDVNERLDFYTSNIKFNIKPSIANNCVLDDGIMEVYTGDLRNDLKKCYIYKETLKYLTKELSPELAAINYEIDTDGIVQDPQHLVTAIKLARCRRFGLRNEV